MEIVNLKHGMDGMIVAKNDGCYYIFDSKKEYDEYDNKKKMRSFNTLGEAKAFLDGVYWACMKAAFGGFK